MSFMSFLTLGLTADAAAAHRHEFSPKATSPSPTSPNHPNDSVGSQTSMEPPYPSLTPSNGDVSPGSSHKRTRTKTSYHFAEPPPSAINSNHFPHLLRSSRALILQLQRLHPTARPLPAFDVLRATALGHKFWRKCPLTMLMKGTLGPNDLVMISSEEYTEEEDEEEEGDGEERRARNVIAAIRQVPKKDKDSGEVNAVVFFATGDTWEVSQLQNGNYDFVLHQSNGSKLTARWISRLPNSRRRVSQTISPGKDIKGVAGEKKFQFSMIDSATRRHPILATLAGRRIELYNQFTVPNMHAGSEPSSPTVAFLDEPPQSGSIAPYGYEGDRVLVDTEEHIKTLIMITGTWVALREGLGGSLRYEDASMATTSSKLNNSKAILAVGIDSPTRLEKRSMDSPMGKVLRRGTLLAHQATTSTRQPKADDDSGFSSGSTSTKRAHSTGSNFKRLRSSSILARAFASPTPSACTSRAPSPEPVARFVAMDQVYDTPPQKPPLVRATPSHDHRHSMQNPIIDSPTRPSRKASKARKDQSRRKSMPPKSTLEEERSEKKKWTAKFGKVFNLLRRGAA